MVALDTVEQLNTPALDPVDADRTAGRLALRAAIGVEEISGKARMVRRARPRCCQSTPCPPAPRRPPKRGCGSCRAKPADCSRAAPRSRAYDRRRRRIPSPGRRRSPARRLARADILGLGSGEHQRQRVGIQPAIGEAARPPAPARRYAADCWRKSSPPPRSIAARPALAEARISSPFPLRSSTQLDHRGGGFLDGAARHVDHRPLMPSAEPPRKGDLLQIISVSV